MASGRGPLVTGSASFNKAQQQRSQQVQDHNKLCSSLTQLSLYVYPTGSFRISKDEMCLSPEAFKDLEAVEDKPTVMQFLKNYGSHVSDGIHHVGGIQYRT
jgi:hypothetical protein